MARARSVMERIAALFVATALSACVSYPPPPAALTTPRIAGDGLVSLDGAVLGLTIWRAENPKAVILALHGMNDYAHAFDGLGVYLSQEAGISLYAYDQRGFGRSPDFGRWAGEGALKADLRAAITAVRADNPGLPLVALGHSMGAAVIMAAAAEAPLEVDGAILAAPGVWGGEQLPVAYRIALNVAAGVAPGKALTGERAKRQATDNIEILREMRADPLVIKPTRLDAVLGVARMMGSGYDASDEFGGRILFLYGEKDEIIPIRVMRKASRRICGEVDRRVYPEGWHLLFRDLQARHVYRDVADWAGSVGEKNAAGPMLSMGPAALACLALCERGSARLFVLRCLKGRLAQGGGETGLGVLEKQRAPRQSRL